MDEVPDLKKTFNVLVWHLATLPIHAHLASNQAIIAHCNSYLNRVLRFWNDNRSKVTSIEALTTLLSYDYHQVMKTGSRELRHLINMNELNLGHLDVVRQLISIDSSINQINLEQLKRLNDDGYAIEGELTEFIDSALCRLEDSIEKLSKASIKIWNKPSLSRSVIPKDLYFFVSHATADKETATAICAELESIGISTWRDDKDIMGGDSIPAEIGKGLEKATHFGLLYSNASKDRPWVRTEFENALMLRERTSKPKIIPLLLDGLMPPTILGNIKGIPFDDFKEGMELLWRSLGVPAGSRISLGMIFKFLKRAAIADDSVRYCNRERKEWGIEMGEETFNDMEDVEAYFLSFPRCEAEAPLRRFEWTMVSFPNRKAEKFMPSPDFAFYTYRIGAIAGAHLLNTIEGIAQRLLTMLKDIEASPLPSEITYEEQE